MSEILAGKGLVKLAEGHVFVTGLKGPLEEGWEEKVDAFVVQVCAAVEEDAAESAAPQPHAA